MSQTLQCITDGIWTSAAPLRFMGLQVNTRMTVCRLSDGGLVLISPVARTEDLAAAVEGLGPIRALVAPNLLHHLYLGDWMEAYPSAAPFGPAGLTKKRPDLAPLHPLDETFDQTYGADLLHIPIAGMPKLNESLFFHRASGTLVVTDFCFYLPASSGLTGLFASITGVKTRPRCEPSFRVLVWNRGAFRDALRPLRTLPIRHLSMCHHEVLTDGASESLHRILDALGVAEAPADT